MNLGPTICFPPVDGETLTLAICYNNYKEHSPSCPAKGYEVAIRLHIMLSCLQIETITKL